MIGTANVLTAPKAVLGRAPPPFLPGTALGGRRGALLAGRRLRKVVDLPAAPSGRSWCRSLALEASVAAGEDFGLLRQSVADVGFVSGISLHVPVMLTSLSEKGSCETCEP